MKTHSHSDTQIAVILRLWVEEIHMLIFFSTITDVIFCWKLDTFPTHSVGDSNRNFSKTVSYCQDIHKTLLIWLRLFCCLPTFSNLVSLMSSIIIDLNNIGQTLCLFQADIISLSRSLHYFFWCQVCLFSFSIR